MVNAQLRYYLHIQPESLTDDEWATAWTELQWIREEERAAQSF